MPHNRNFFFHRKAAAGACLLLCLTPLLSLSAPSTPALAADNLPAPAAAGASSSLPDLSAAEAAAASSLPVLSAAEAAAVSSLPVSGADAEEEARGTELFEVAEIAPPIRLGNDGDTQTLCLQSPSDYCRAERRMIHVGIAAEKDDIQVIPAPGFHFFLGCRQPILYSICFHGGKDTTK